MPASLFDFSAVKLNFSPNPVKLPHDVIVSRISKISTQFQNELPKQLSHESVNIGANGRGDWTWTSDLHVPNVARYQLRYAPTHGIILCISLHHNQEQLSFVSVRFIISITFWPYGKAIVISISEKKHIVFNSVEVLQFISTGSPQPGLNLESGSNYWQQLAW